MPYDTPHFASSFLGEEAPEQQPAPAPQQVVVAPQAAPPALFDTKRVIIFAIVTILTIIILKYLFDRKKAAETE